MIQIIEALFMLLCLIVVGLEALGVIILVHAILTAPHLPEGTDL